MKSLIASVLSLFLAAALVRTAYAVPVGVPAPPLLITNWVQGAPVDLAAVRSNKVVVIEFWATWCPPCLVSIPHLTALQKKYKNDAVIIGVSSEDVPTVKKFVAKMGDQMDYTVASDEGGVFSDTYMSDAELMGESGAIPYAFVVDRNGMVVWEGSPLPGLGIDETLESVVKGTFDVEKSKKLFTLRRTADTKLSEFLAAAKNNPDDPKLDALGKDLEALDSELGGLEPGKKFDALELRKMMRFEMLANQYASAVIQGQDPQTFGSLLNGIQTNAPADFSMDDFKEDIRTRRAFVEYSEAAKTGTNEVALAALAKSLADNTSKNSKILAIMARTLLMGDDLKVRDIPLATKLARDAVDTSNAQDLNALDAYALALFDSGKIADAVSWEQKAVAAADNDHDRELLQANLKKYQDALAK